jgi:hypothetical protein
MVRWTGQRRHIDRNDSRIECSHRSLLDATWLHASTTHASREGVSCSREVVPGYVDLKELTMRAAVRSFRISGQDAQVTGRTWRRCFGKSGRPDGAMR